MNVRWISL